MVKVIGAVCLFVATLGSGCHRGASRAKPVTVAPAEPVVFCNTLRISERIVEARCHSSSDADTSELIGQALIGVIREAEATATPWIQHMGTEAIERRSAPVCTSRQTQRSRNAQAIAGAGQAYTDAYQPAATATCTENFNSGVNCKIYQRPTYQTPLPPSEYESSCDDGQLTGYDSVMRYELLTETEALERGGESTKPLRDTVAGYRSMVRTIWAKRVQAGR